MADQVKIPCSVVTRTPHALLIHTSERQVWVPLSQIDEEIQEPTGGMGLMHTTAIVVPTWVAKEKGLEAEKQDTSTLDLFGGAQ